MVKVLVLVPGSMQKRLLCETPILSSFLKKNDAMLSVVSALDSDREYFLSRGIEWSCIYGLAQDKKSVLNFFHRICGAAQYRLLKYIGICFESLAFRFNHIHQFSSHLFKMRMPKDRKQREALAGNYVEGMLGFPFSRSRLVYRLMYGFLYSRYRCRNNQVYSYYSRIKPDVVVFMYSQNILLEPWYIEARRLGIKTVSVTGSWDRLTTKGHLFPNYHSYIVHSNKMKSELVKYHEVDPEKVTNVGWPQMDRFMESGNFSKRDLCDKYEIPLDRKVILFAANSERFGKNEPAVIEHIRRNNLSSLYIDPVYLMIRPHPNDQRWDSRFTSECNHSASELLMKAESGNIQLLGELLHSVDLVISTQGSISLDAIAMDTPVINLAFDCVEVDESESISRLYEMDHYQEITNSGAVRIVKSFVELDDAINYYLNNAGADSENRERLREREVYPFDGKASQRLVDTVMKII